MEWGRVSGQEEGLDQGRGCGDGGKTGLEAYSEAGMVETGRLTDGGIRENGCGLPPRYFAFQVEAGK